MSDSPRRRQHPYGLRLLAVLFALVALSVAVPALAQVPDGHAPQTPQEAVHGEPPHGEAAHAAPHEGEHHEESTLSFLSRVANFLILAGGLVYLLRSPLGQYLANRSEQIRADLVNADAMRTTASAELQEIDARMKALPAEIAALKERGHAEVEAERQRIRTAAAAERERLLDHARREIGQQLQAAQRALKQEAADLAVGVARARVTREISDADRARLLDRYVAQVKTAHD